MFDVCNMGKIVLCDTFLELNVALLYCCFSSFHCLGHMSDPITDINLCAAFW